MDVSIITINLNNLTGLKATYASIVMQTHTDWEWIVIDGGSTGCDREFIEQHKGEIAYWCSEPDKGVYNAQNKGIIKAKGTYLIFMNSGDTFHDKYVLEKVFSKPHTADVMYGDWVRINEDGNKVKMKAPERFSLHFIYNDNICHQAIFVKNEIMKHSPYDETYKIYADWAKWIELTLKKCTFEYLPFNICRFAVGGLSCSSKDIDKEKEMLRQRELSPAITNTLDDMSLLPEITDPKLTRKINQLIKYGKTYKTIIYVAVKIASRIRKMHRQ